MDVNDFFSEQYTIWSGHAACNYTALASFLFLSAENIPLAYIHLNAARSPGRLTLFHIQSPVPFRSNWTFGPLWRNGARERRHGGGSISFRGANFEHENASTLLCLVLPWDRRYRYVDC